MTPRADEVGLDLPAIGHHDQSVGTGRGLSPAPHRIGGIVFVNETAALSMLAIGWAVMMPILMRLGETLDGVSSESEAPVVERAS